MLSYTEFIAFVCRAALQAHTHGIYDFQQHLLMWVDG